MIPSWVVRFLQTRISLNRIAVYLEEDEVSAQVSSLKTDTSIPLLDGAEEEGLGLENASLRWNELAEEEEDKDSNGNGSGGGSPEASLDGSTARGDDSGSEGGGNENNKFELRDISVVFPEDDNGGRHPDGENLSEIAGSRKGHRRPQWCRLSVLWIPLLRR